LLAERDKKMKKKDIIDLRKKEVDGLHKMLVEKRNALDKKTVEMFSGKEKNIKVLKNLRREIAQVLTLIKEKEIMKKISQKEGDK
jgi:ribosomal protein L29